MAKSRHIIRQQILELSLESDQGVREIQEEVSDVFKSRILPRMERLFDDLSQEGQVLKIDKLELDLGNIDLKYLKDDLPLKVEQLLEEQITKILYQQQEGIPGDVLSVSVNWSDSKLETFQFLLRSGVHPWNSPFKDQSISQLFEELVPKYHSQVRDILIRELGHEYVRKRVVYQFSEEQFRALILLISEAHGPAGLSLLNGLLLFGKKLSILSGVIQVWNHQVKEILLQSITFRGETPATTVALVQKVLGNLLTSWAGVIRRRNGVSERDPLISLIIQMNEAFRLSEVRAALGKVAAPLKQALEQAQSRGTRSNQSKQTLVNESKNSYQDDYKSDYQESNSSQSNQKGGSVSAKFQNRKTDPLDTFIDEEYEGEISDSSPLTSSKASEVKSNPESKSSINGPDNIYPDHQLSDGDPPAQAHATATKEGVVDHSQSSGKETILSKELNDQLENETIDFQNADVIASVQRESEGEPSQVVGSKDNGSLDSEKGDRKIQDESTIESSSDQSAETESFLPDGEVSNSDHPVKRQESYPKEDTANDPTNFSDTDSNKNEVGNPQAEHSAELAHSKDQNSGPNHSEEEVDKGPFHNNQEISQDAKGLAKKEINASSTVDHSGEQKTTQNAFGSQKKRDDELVKEKPGQAEDELIEQQSYSQTDQITADGTSEISGQKDFSQNDIQSPDKRKPEREEKPGTSERKAGKEGVTQSENIQPMNRIVPHPEDRFLAPLWRKPPMIIEEAQINNAGLALLWPYLPILFKGLNWVKDGAFVSEEYQFRAIHFLQYMATGAATTEEQELTFNKLLVGMLPEIPVPLDVSMTDEELEEAEHLLKTMLESWKALKSGSVELLRQTFLQKEGLLKKDMASWKLFVERSAYDILLDRLPWSYSVVKLPWMDNLINVEW